MPSGTTLIIRAPTWVGDCVMATPALAAFRRGFPDAHIVLVARAYTAEVFRGGPWFDELVQLPSPKAGGAFRRTLALTARLRRRRADLGVLLPNSFSSALLMWLARPRKILGYARDGRSFFLSMPVEPARRGGCFVPGPMVDYYLKLAEVAGCPADDRDLHLATTASEEAAASELLDVLNVSDGSALVGLNPGAAFGSAKCWPPEYFAELAARLAARERTRVLVLCGPAEREIARTIVEQAHHAGVHGVHDRDVPLGTLKAVIRRLSLLVTNDSGPRHFAAAFRIPTVTIFGPTDERWSETGRDDEIKIVRDLDCRPCMLRVCPRDHACMRSIRPEDVYEAAAALLGRSR